MLDFFRRYQRYFFFVITVVIIISFSFFGTYSTLGSNSWREQTAFTDVNGREVPRLDVDEMALFLATDQEDQKLFGGGWGVNFLNDGVIRNDFLEKGLAQELALAYKDDLQEEINKRLAKEKKYSLYSHPQASFIGVEGVWNYLAPQMSAHFAGLRSANQGLDPDAFNHRMQLYLGQKELPPTTLRYILRYQEQQYSWLKPDPELAHSDLSLFGYHTFEDWFGPSFTRLISEFIINTALLAEQQGYHVSNAEALADLIRNAQVSYQDNQDHPYLGVTSVGEYFNEQLRRLNMDQMRAVKIWRQVLLFRRYFHDAGGAALVDALLNRQLHQFAHENVTVDLYQLPAELQLANQGDLQKFEVYLQAVAKPNKKDPLALPQQFSTVAAVEKEYPELIQKRYELEVAQTNQKALQGRVSLRELWNWEVDASNWQALKKQFPDLALQPEEGRDERFAALDRLNSTTRALVDQFAKKALIRSHPEWIDQALESAPSEKRTVGVRLEGGKAPLPGVEAKEKRRELARLLDEAPLGAAAPSDSPLYTFTGDEETYYRIAVIHREEKPEILTFAEARQEGALEELQNRLLEKYYLKIREDHPLLYEKQGGGWHSFQAVKELVANQFFEKSLSALKPIYQTLFSEESGAFTPDRAASLRFYSYFQKVQRQLTEDPALAQMWIKEKEKEKGEENEAGSISPNHPSLAEQWKIRKETVTFNRQTGRKAIDQEAFRLNPGAWSSIQTPVNGELAFFQVTNQGLDAEESGLSKEQAKQLQFLLGAEAERQLMRQVLQELKAKEALSLAYLRVPVEEPASVPETVE